MIAATTSIAELLADAKIGALVLGFPKCATTSFAQWLDTSPHIDVSTPKETFQLCPEFTTNLERAAKSNLQDCFQFPSEEVTRVEATTLNIYSRKLLEAVTATPHIKVVILTRDPVETILSWHNQMKQAGQHFDEDLSTSWKYAVDDATDETEFLQRYDQICSHGVWTKRWIDALGHGRILIVQDTELKEDPDGLRIRVNSFFTNDLEIEGDVPKRNTFSKIRFPMLYRAVRTPVVKRVLADFERTVPAFGSLRRYLRDNVFLKPTKKSGEAELVLEEVRHHLSEDQELISALLNQNHAEWSNTGT